ncbi:conjugal transfer protein [Pectobacterium parmentieri]|uniref:MobQ family relaxase n=1 Tax=Pectobacterium TaxID=122277 RepID=UPI00166189F5|nr:MULTISPECIES: MobQ family relaxase [Pectobacterium]MBD0848748.1 conjugal transfer protein [Pectobacterium carotovorum subsp. carotovorum]MBK4826732.1 conjugal transfer protein TraA [Pectobacterium carotovorum subsp. carotovorum]MBN3059417.1 MobA/MobL family protein [Pectobacterium versatile]MCL6354397.1 conjugal transfer protein [Pectobacterium parmentieri]UAY90675.1 MobA/MobL family protein [Pectobacterium polaris]
MAIFHLEFKIVKRSEGMSSCRKAAYHNRSRITDDRTGNTYDFSHRTDLFHHQILAPVSAPAHIIESSATLWNEVERVERQKDGQTARYFDVAIPCELSNQDKIKLVVEYCQKNFVDKGMIADIAFHDLNGENPHAHVMLTLKPITADGFGKKERSWNDKKNVILWRESWSVIANRYLADAGSNERIDHRSIDAQHSEALENATITLDVEEKALWLAKATATSRPPMQRVHRAKWNSKHVQEKRAAEQAVRDEMKQEAQATYSVFKDLDLQIVVDLNSFTVSELPEPVEIILTEMGSKSASSGQKPVLVAPAPHTRTKLKTSPSPTASTVKRTPVKSKRKQVKPRQDGIFKRFTLLVIEFFKERFIWAKKKPAPVSVDAKHDKHIAENYVFDEVQGIYVSRSEYEKRLRFNSSGYKPTSDEIRRFPSRPKEEQHKVDNSLDFTPAPPPVSERGRSHPSLKPAPFNKK